MFYRCKNGLCTLDHSKPWKHLRQVTDQGFCDCAAAIAVAHTIDDRRIAQTSSTLSSNDFTSIRYLRDCVAGENYAKFEGALVGCEGGNVTGTFDKYKTHGAPFEWKVGYKMREEKCDGGNARRQNHVVRGGIQENCLTIQDIKGQVKSYGPVLHHIKVHKELYSYPTVYSLQGPVKKEILEYDDFQDDEFDGFTTIEIAGFGTDNKKGVKYLVIKTSWGPNYGINKGYLQVSEQAFERFMLPKCGIERKYDWNGEHNEELKGKWFKFPIIYYSIKKSDPLWENLKTTIQHDIEQVLHFRRKIAMARPVNVHITDESLKVQEAEEEFPKLKYAINSVFHYLKRKYRNEDYKFEFDTLVQADLSIVAGRRISLILKVRRNRNSKSKVVISDEGFVKAIVWIPLDSSKGGEDRKRIYHFEDACDPNPHLRKKAKYYMVDLEEVFERESTKIAEDVPRSTMLFKISVIMAVGFLLAANNCWNW
mmetsp:Transcript_6578/g.8013  ORF Transcript_6578/g.8013 Transcript_6578/m.8013 type:complete len:480 (+) Transcript_6578:96-1535(+)